MDSAFVSMVYLIICEVYFSIYECPIIDGVRVLIAYSIMMLQISVHFSLPDHVHCELNINCPSRSLGIHIEVLYVDLVVLCKHGYMHSQYEVAMSADLLVYEVQLKVHFYYSLYEGLARELYSPSPSSY